MPAHWTFEAAADCWLNTHAAAIASDEDLARLDEAETYLLHRAPGTPREADLLLQVLMQQSGERSDGLDQTALGNLRRYVNRAKLSVVRTDGSATG